MVTLLENRLKISFPKYSHDTYGKVYKSLGGRERLREKITHMFNLITKEFCSLIRNKHNHPALSPFSTQTIHANPT